MREWYWNQDNFETLLDIAAKLRKTKELVLLAEYCELREKGLRKKALACVTEFLAVSRALSPERQLELALYLAEVHLKNRQAHQFPTQPILERFIMPTLYQAASPGSMAFRHLALVASYHYFEEWRDENVDEMLYLALEYDPLDTHVYTRLLDMLLGQVDYAMHHLDESFFIGSEEHCQTALIKIEKLLEASSKHDNLSLVYQEEYEELLSLFNDWMEYSHTSQEYSFPQWCQRKGRDYGWSAAYYWTKT